MKILVINGSPKGRGNTFKLTSYVEKYMLQADSRYDFEYIFLKDINLGLCRGCFNCISAGEDKCPLKDDRELLINKMKESKGIIFASPGYVLNMTGIMKNFYDRTGYTAHRPAFFNRNALLICTVSGIGKNATLKSLGSLPLVNGFNTIDKLGLNTPPHWNIDHVSEKEKKIIRKAAVKFHINLQSCKRPAVNMEQIVTYNVFKNVFPLISQLSKDREYWREHNWFDRKCRYYSEAGINILYYQIGKFAGYMARKRTLSDLKKSGAGQPN